MNSPSQPPTAFRWMKFGSRRRHYVAFVMNAGLLAGVAYWLSKNVKYADLLTQLQQIPLHAILVAMAMNAVVLALYGLRLASMLQVKPIPCFLVTNVGFTFNSLIPFRIGEGVKIYFGTAYFGLAIGALGAAILMEKLYDLSAIIVLMASVGANSRSDVIDIARPTILALAAAAVLGGLIIARLRTRGEISPPSEWPIVKSARLDVFVRQAETLLANQNFARPAFFTALIWMINVSLVLILFRTILPETHFSFLDAMTVQVVAALAIAVPASPAGLGVFEAGIVAYLTTMYGVQTERAISAALAYHLSITAPHTAIATAFLASMIPRLLKARFAP